MMSDIGVRVQRWRTKAWSGSLENRWWHPIVGLGFAATDACEPQVNLVQGRISYDLTHSGLNTLRQTNVCGYGLTRDVAVRAAVGEAIERYCGGLYWVQDGMLPVQSLPPADINSCPTFSTAELVRLDSSRYEARTNAVNNAQWMACTEESCGRQYRIPRQMVYCPYHPSHAERLFWVPTTTGLAAGTSVTQAKLQALLEVIERDAIACSWLLRIPGLELQLKELTGAREYGELSRNILRGGLRIRIALVSLDVPVPVCIAALYDTNYPRVAFGSAAAFTIQQAALKAIYESCATRHFLRLNEIAFPNQIRFSPGDIDTRNYLEHGQAWAALRFPEEGSWIFGDRPIQTEAVNSYLDCLEILHGLNHAVYACDLSSREFVHLPFFAFRIVIPTMQPLNPGRFQQMLKSERLYHLARRFGVQVPISPVGLQLHPFC